MTQTVLDVLVAARALIATPKQWCINQLSKIAPDGSEQFCARGAIHRAGNVDDAVDSLGRACAIALADQIPWEFASTIDIRPHVEYLRPAETVAQYNNTHTHADILAVFDRAIAAERAKFAVSALMSEALSGLTKELADA